MKILVNIPDSTLVDLRKKQNRTEVDVAVLNGTPLPKGHGRLIDEDSIPYLYPVDNDGNEGDGITVESSIKSLPTIIEADKEKEDEEN